MATESYIPLEIQAGDTLEFTIGYADYHADDGWLCTYTLVNGTDYITFSSTADGELFSFVVTATSTGSWNAGDYTYLAKVSKEGEIHTVEKGEVTIFDVYSAAVDRRSYNKRMLDLLETLIPRMLANPDQQYSIAGRSITKKNLTEVLKLRDSFKARVNEELRREKRKRGEYPQNMKYVCFRNY